MLALPCCFCDSVYWSLDLMVHLSLKIFFKTFSIFFYLLKRSCSSVWEDFSTRVSGLGIRNLDLSPPSDILFKLPTLSELQFPLHGIWVQTTWEVLRRQLVGQLDPSATYWGLNLGSSRIHCWSVWPLASGSLRPFPSSSRQWCFLFSLQRMSPPSPPTAPAGRGVAVVAVCEQDFSNYCFLLINCFDVSCFWLQSSLLYVGAIARGYLIPFSCLCLTRVWGCLEVTGALINQQPFNRYIASENVYNLSKRNMKCWSSPCPGTGWACVLWTGFLRGGAEGEVKFWCYSWVFSTLLFVTLVASVI